MAQTSSQHHAIGGRHQQKKATYTFDAQPEYGMKAATLAANANTRKHRRHHQRTSSDDGDPTDGAGSLTYSAASSINSAGESTDSSFADIMKVLDMQDPQDLGPLMKDRGMTPAEYKMHLQLAAHQQQSAHSQFNHGKLRSSQASVASSLQYSTDGESNFLNGIDLVSAQTGQPSDSLANDGGMYINKEPDDLFDDSMFAPAEPTDSLKKRKKEKRNRNKDASSSSNQQGNNSGGKHPYKTSQSMSTANTSKQSESSRRTARHKNETPPRIPRNRSRNTTIEDDICYAEWWMSCFPDAFKEMMPKR